MNIDDEFLGYNCTRCNKLIYETDSDFHWFTAFKKCKLCVNREVKNEEYK